MKPQDILEKITWLKEQRMIGRFRCEDDFDNKDLSTLINQVILALGKPEPLRKNKQCGDNFNCEWFNDPDFPDTKCEIQCSTCFAANDF